MRAARRVDKRVARARQLRREMTAAERKLRWHLRELAPEGFHFRRQATIGPYFVDVACHTMKLVIEVDGGQHGQAVQIKRDLKRETYLRRNGYRVLRFWNTDVQKNIEGVMTLICGALEQVPPTPDPSPPQAGGGENQAVTPKPPPPQRGGE